jgi:hypothetical protein
MNESRCKGDERLDELCERLVWWCRTRRFYGRSSVPPSLLGRLAKRTRPLRPGGPDAGCSAEMAALYMALIGQPADALDRRVFELHYFHRVGNVKAAAAALGIGRQHWYTLLRSFRQRIHAASQEILELNAMQLEATRVNASSAGQSSAKVSHQAAKVSPLDATSSCSTACDT